MPESQGLSIFNLSENHCIPHFQPIINVVNGTIMGYEVLGRYSQPGSLVCQSLGQFFHGVTDQSRIQKIDFIIREKALHKAKFVEANTRLFLNTLPVAFSQFKEDNFGDGIYSILKLTEKYQFPRDKIILEITEDEFEEDITALLKITDRLRGYGFKIAIDDLGVGFSNLERIGYLHPDIIKVDIRIMRESLQMNSFKQVLHAIADMSEKLGSQLLFEGIETEEEVNLALSMGANLLQGFYFSKPQPEFQEKQKFQDNMSEILEKFSGMRFIQILESIQKQQIIVEELKEIFKGISAGFNGKLHEYLTKVLPSLPERIVQIIVCDLHGYQLTPTYFKNNGSSWQEKERDIGNNFAWKPFFFKHKAEGLHFNQKWGVTEPFHDIKTGGQYVIFTFSLAENVILIAKVDWESDLID